MGWGDSKGGRLCTHSLELVIWASGLPCTVWGSRARRLGAGDSTVDKVLASKVTNLDLIPTPHLVPKHHWEKALSTTRRSPEPKQKFVSERTIKQNKQKLSYLNTT